MRALAQSLLLGLVLLCVIAATLFFMTMRHCWLLPVVTLAAGVAAWARQSKKQNTRSSIVKKKAAQAATKKLADDNNAIQTTKTAVDDAINGTAKLTRLKFWITRSRAVLT